MGYETRPYYTVSGIGTFDTSHTISLQYNAPTTATMTVLKQN